MAVPLKFLMFLSLVGIAAAQQLETDYILDPGETTREYIRDKNEEMKKFLKEELQKMFAEQQSKVAGQLGSLNETLQADHQELSQSISDLTTALFPPPPTEVEEVNADEGTIEISGGTNPHVRTKIWVLRLKKGDSPRVLRFVLEENGLGEDARLSLWGSDDEHGNQTMWNGSQVDWREEKQNWGNVVLVTLVISPGGAERPSFKLKFNTNAYTHTGGGWVHSSELVLREGRQEVSYPPNNTEEYPPRSLFVGVVAPPRGGSFGLKFLDLPGTPPHNCGNDFSVWFLQENSAGFPFTRLPSSAYTRCGRVGVISEPLGNSTVAILRFETLDGPVGKGFRVRVN